LTKLPPKVWWLPFLERSVYQNSNFAGFNAIELNLYSINAKLFFI